MAFNSKIQINLNHANPPLIPLRQGGRRFDEFSPLPHIFQLEQSQTVERYFNQCPPFLKGGGRHWRAEDLKFLEL